MAISINRPATPVDPSGWDDTGTAVKLDNDSDIVLITASGVASSDDEKLRVTGKIRADGPTGMILSEMGFQSTGGGILNVIGNARGTGAVDLQVERNASFRVASGANSFVAGRNSSATGSYGVAIGNTCSSQGTGSVAMGDTCTNVGTSSFAVGRNNTSTASYSIALGREAQASWQSSIALGGNLSSISGDTQGGLLVGRARTTSATPVTITSDGGAASSGNAFVLTNNSTYFFSLSIVARVVGAANDRAVYKLEFVADKSGTTASTVSILGSPVKTDVYEDTAAFDVAVSADTTLGSVKIDVTGGAGKDVHWVCFGTWTQCRKS